jgi:hypothetical protein
MRVQVPLPAPGVAASSSRTIYSTRRRRGDASYSFRRSFSRLETGFSAFGRGNGTRLSVECDNYLVTKKRILSCSLRRGSARFKAGFEAEDGVGKVKSDARMAFHTCLIAKMNNIVTNCFSFISPSYVIE